MKYIEIPEQLDFLSVDELRVLMWIYIFSQNFVQTRPKYKTQVNALIKEEELKSIIYFKYRVDRLQNLIKAYNINRNLSDYQQHCLFMLYDAVKDFARSEVFKKYFSQKLMTNINCIYVEVQKMPMKIPKCLWCEENILFMFMLINDRKVVTDRLCVECIVVKTLINVKSSALQLLCKY